MTAYFKSGISKKYVKVSSVNENYVNK